MPIRIRDAKNSPPDRSWIQQQYFEYVEDLSQLSMNTGMFPAVGEYGEREAELMGPVGLVRHVHQHPIDLAPLGLEARAHRSQCIGETAGGAR